jgi:hypothetical protein
MLDKGPFGPFFLLGFRLVICFRKDGRYRARTYDLSGVNSNRVFLAHLSHFVSTSERQAWRGFEPDLSDLDFYLIFLILAGLVRSC